MAVSVAQRTLIVWKLPAGDHRADEGAGENKFYS